MKLFSLLLLALLPVQSFASTASLMEKIRARPEYQAEVASAKKVGGSFDCSLSETVKSKDYSSLPNERSRYALVVLVCTVDPNDDGDPYHEAGLAVYANGKVVSFATAYIAEPD